MTPLVLKRPQKPAGIEVGYSLVRLRNRWRCDTLAGTAGPCIGEVEDSHYRRSMWEEDDTEGPKEPPQPTKGESSRKRATQPPLEP